MNKLTDYTSYADAQHHWSVEKLWDIFDGSREQLNIAHECIDRHATDPERVAIIVVHADGHDEILTYREIAQDSSRFAHYLAEQGIGPGDRVAVMLEPSRAFYTTLFGVMKTGAIAVPLFTLFGPDGIRLRVGDCAPKMLFTNDEKISMVEDTPSLVSVVVNNAFLTDLSRYDERYTVRTGSDDLAIFQYTSGTTREQPDAIKHSHKALVTLMVAALYGTGLRPGDRFFCPSSPAWGHGLWHGTLAPLALGLTIGAFSGRYNASRLLQALSEHKFTNMSAAATHYRMIRNSPDVNTYSYSIKKLSFTGEPIDSATESFIEDLFGASVCSMYGTTEIGVILVSYPGADDFPVKNGSLGKPIPGGVVEVHDADGNVCLPGTVGEMKVLRRGAWIPTKDLGRTDEDGYFYHAGRADDVIISAGWTMSAVEIEDAILKHPDVLEAAAIGVPDELRGQVVKAFVVAKRPGDEQLKQDIQDSVRSQLSQHEYPRQIAFVSELPKTPAGKVHRKKLREQEAGKVQREIEPISQQ
ncbi:acetate--CoA ligase [Pollutimonas subterranea]|uniref:Acetate--CoA ligase n=1 Tax=Pollutimonas subterranea TaxID=2045210 RepID=A0A2N4U8J5_9BURK|nr:acyl-CoA synthetase [Pollutimonas subterranea]PLC51337.1 acetate--CoA ligase [Pollutimonas subterranea]